jgi:hypothetical protein
VRKKARISTNEPLTKTSGQQKRHRDQPSSKPDDTPTQPPPALEEEEESLTSSSSSSSTPPTPTRSGASPRHRGRDRDPELEASTSHLRRRFDLEAALEKVSAQPSPSMQLKELANEKPPTSGPPTLRPRMPMSCVPRRCMSKGEMLKLPLDHRAGFVLAHIDGATNIRTVIDLCGMPDTEVVTLLERLLALRVIALK